jgi:GNAT superfamily N-acetyltransferase
MENALKNYIARKITDKELLAGWEQLHPGREHVFITTMTYPEKDFDHTILEKYINTNFGIFDGDKLIGTSSGHKTSEDYYRGRGIWVHEDYRGQGLSRILWELVFSQAKKEKCKWVWCLPKKEAFWHAENRGFKRVSEFIQFDWGVNAYAVLDLNTKTM